MFRQFCLRLIKRLRFDDLFGFAAQISFYLLLSLFPFLLILGSVINHMHIINYQELISELEEARMVPTALLSLLSSSRDVPSLTALPIFLVTLLWSSSKGTRSIMNGIHMAFRTRETRNYWSHLVLSILYTLALIVVIILFVILIVYGNVLASYLATILDADYLVSFLAHLIRFLIPFTLLFLICLSLYTLVPDRSLTVKDALPGAALATVLMFVVSPLFSFFSNTSIQYSILYGSISGIVIVCFWMYYFSFIFMLGAEINAVIYELRHDTTLISTRRF